MKLLPPPIPDNVATTPLERATPQTPAAEIYYPSLTKGEMLTAYPVLIWPQPWFSPEGAHAWPKLIDIDRTPFTAWSKRIGQ
jgi:hypothetical protein